MNGLLNWTTIAWAALLLSSMVSMMAVFMGSGSADLHGLLMFQFVMVPVTVVAIIAYGLQARHLSGKRAGFAHLMANIPGPMLFVVASALCMTLIAEMALILVSTMTEMPRPWLEHVPAVTSALSALALAAGFGYRRAYNKAA